VILFILRNEVKQVLEKIARQKQADVGGTFKECYDEILADYQSGAISEGLIDFVLKHPDAQIAIGYGMGYEP
jgi:hypothetical protein